MQIATSDSNNISIRTYNIALLNPTSGEILNSSNCDRDTCTSEREFTVDIPIMCPYTRVKVTADNGFGERLLSNLIDIGMLVH